MAELEIKDVRVSAQNPSFLHRHFFKRKKEPAYIVGRRFDVEFTIKNISGRQVRGAEFELILETQSDPENRYLIKLEKIGPDDEQQFSLDFSVLETGFCRILIRQGREFDADAFEHFHQDTDYEDIEFAFQNTEYSKHISVHIASIFGENPEKFYEFWALIFAVIGLLYPLLRDLVKFLNDLITACHAPSIT